MFLLKKAVGYRSIKPRTHMNLFKQMIRPILLYGSEIWACELGKKGIRNAETIWNRSQKLIAEKLNLSAARFALGIHNRTPIAAIRGELGLYPLSITVIDTMSKYFERLDRQNCESLLGDAFKTYLSC